MNILIAIGIDIYNDPKIDNLNNCVSDVKALSELLAARYNFEDPRLLIKPEETTGEKLFDFLNDEFKNALPEDNILLIFAGHGGYDEGTNTAYWKPSDARYNSRHNWFSLTELISMMRTSPAHHIGLILDSCYAGAIFEEAVRGTGDGVDRNLKSRFAVTSGNIEKVKDGKRGEQSPFNKTLLSILQDNTKHDFLLSELGLKIRESFNQRYVQVPRSGPIYKTGDEGGAFVLELKGIDDVNMNWSYPNYDESKPIIDQLYELIEFLYAEINFVPPQLLAQFYPFRADESRTGFVGDTYLHTSNNKVIEFFDGIEIVNGKDVIITNEELKTGVENPEQKAYSIVKQLNLNLIIAIDGDNRVERIDIRLELNNEETTLIKKLDALRINEISKEELLPNHSEPTLSRAYANYVLGNITWAVEELLFLKEKVRDSNLNEFLIIYNLTRLKNVLWRHYYGDVKRQDLIDKINEIDLTNEYCSNLKSPKFSIIEWIYREYFLSSGYRKIYEIRDQIIDHQKMTVNGGWGQNGFVWDLIYTYAKFYHFIRSNYIVFERFKEFNDITDAFMEGLIASHAVKGDNSKLTYFNDYYLDIILHHCKPKKIREYIHKYSLKWIELHDKGQDSMLPEKVNYLINNYLNFLGYSEANFESNTTMESNQLQRYLHNGLTIAAVTDFKVEQIQMITKSLIGYIQKGIHRFDFDYLHIFLARNIEKIGNELMDEVILNMITSRRVNSQKIYETLAFGYRKNSYTINWEEEKFNEALEVFIKKETDQYDLYVFVEIARMLEDEKQKESCSKIIHEHIEKEIDYKLIEIAVIHGIIEYTDKIENELINLAVKDKSKGGHTPFSRTFNTNRPLDALLNICFKLEKDLNDDKYRELNGVNEYYEWLLSVDTYDYTKFNIEWLRSLGLTSNYYKKFSASKELRDALKNYLKNNEDDFVESEFMNIYVHEPWKV